MRGQQEAVNVRGMASSHFQPDAMIFVRAELCDRLEALQRFSRRQANNDFADSVVGIRLLAAAYGLTPVVRLAEALERAVADGEAGCPSSLYLDRLYDAIGCERLDEAASEAMIASVSVHFA